MADQPRRNGNGNGRLPADDDDEAEDEDEDAADDLADDVNDLDVDDDNDNDAPRSKAKYMKVLRRVANRRSAQVVIDLNDVKDVSHESSPILGIGVHKLMWSW